MTFKLNMSTQVAEAKPYELPPTGNYTVRITDLSLEEVKKQDSEHFGKPYWKLTLTVEDGAYAGTQIFTQVALYESDWGLLALKQLCEAVHPEFIEGEQINLPTIDGNPSPDPWLGQVLEIKGTKFVAGSKRKTGIEREYDEFRVAYRPLKGGAQARAGLGASGLPLPS